MDAMPKRLWVMGLLPLLAAACSSSGSTPPPLPPCTAASGGQVSLGVAAYTAVDPTQTMGCAVFPANPAGATIEYLVVPQSVSTTPDDSQAFKLGGTVLAAPPAPGAAFVLTPAASTAQQFDLRLRLAEREFAAQLPGPLRAPPRVAAAVTPVDSGNVRTFKVCNVLTCDPRKASTLSTVTATALKVGTHIAIYVDNASPTPGLSQSDLDALRSVFDTRLYETDALACGGESDIDNNGMRHDRVRRRILFWGGPDHHGAVRDRQQCRDFLFDRPRRLRVRELSALGVAGHGARAGDVRARIPAHDQLQPAFPRPRGVPRGLVAQRGAVALRRGERRADVSAGHHHLLQLRLWRRVQRR